MYEHREENLVEAKALGRVGQDVGVNRPAVCAVQLATDLLGWPRLA